ncbi:MAG: glycoside hydrolase family 9 protein [Fimbriimonadales bacterium]|nr:glycoside hydrolase family 9 protein [Fimbriimonadales bacterium]
MIRGKSLWGLLLLAAPAARAAELKEVLPLTERIVMVHFDEGHVVHHGKGQKRSDETVVISPLDSVRASLASSYRVSSADDTGFSSVRILRVSRKSKGTDFAWFVDSWVNNRTVNNRPDHTKEHWIYLHLSQPMTPGKSYSVEVGRLATKGPQSATFRFDPGRTRSEAVHVNMVGYATNAPAKFGYLSHWLGDGGGLDVEPFVGRRFWIVDVKTGERAFEGKVAFRRTATDPETNQPDETPNQNFVGADTAECDFSSFRQPGTYVLAIEGVGCSFPFDVRPDAYREPFRIAARGLYHNRSGIALTKPYTEFERPAPHNPQKTPGFRGKLMYTTVQWQDWGSEAGDRAKLEAGFKGPLDVWGWYQDAGDWDSYPTHIRVAQELLLAYEIAPQNFQDGELNIPESGNGLPDIVDEAAWLPRFCHRLRHELLRKGWGTGGVGLRVAGDAFGTDGEGVPSYEDVQRTWVVSGEDPDSTLRYAGAAAQLAHVIGKIGKKDPEGVDWAREAREAFDWAMRNGGTRAGDELRQARLYAAAALFRLTGERRYLQQASADLEAVKGSDPWLENLFGPALLALPGWKSQPSPDTLATARTMVLRVADHSLEAARQRAMRWGGNLWFPMLVGQQTTPHGMELAVGWALTRGADEAKAREYWTALHTTADYFLGCNPLNMVWMTGLGERHPVHVFHMDAWYNGKGQPHPGIIPYGPWRKMKDLGDGPWDADWPNQTLHPKVDLWPGAERWYENRCSPLTNEFTIHQNTAPAAAVYGILAGPAR